MSFSRCRWMELFFFIVSVGLACALLGSCSPDGPKTGSQTNWYRLCTEQTDCGELSCLCGVCTSSCEETSACGALPSAACVQPSTSASTTLCGGSAAPAPVCMARCDDDLCPEGSACSGDVCIPSSGEPDTLRFDLSDRHQDLIGFGSSLAYGENAIFEHPDSDALYDVMFLHSGIQVVRLRNRFDAENVDDLSISAAILQAARERMTTVPVVLMTEGSPPAELKKNGTTTCAGDAETCTLVENADGFDYQGFASHWQDSLIAYAEAGIEPDYLSIQNNPDWVPNESEENEACRFLPTEGTVTLNIEGMDQDVSYPGYQEALAEVSSLLSSLENPPRLIGPEATSLIPAFDYREIVESGALSALAVHLYALDSSETADYAEIAELAQESGLPVFQTEVRAEGLDTAQFIHRVMTEADATMYLQNDFVVPADSLQDDPMALIQLTEDGFETQGPYHAITHYARHTAPGWTRIEATLEDAGGSQVENEDLLVSAWVSPDGDALTTVVINPTLGPRALEMDAELTETFANSELTRTVFDGSESLVTLGSLPGDNPIFLPSESIVTIVLSN